MEYKQKARSGTLDSPYGEMVVNGYIAKNGHKVRDNKLVGVKFDHRVPDHWVRQAAERVKL